MSSFRRLMVAKPLHHAQTHHHIHRFLSYPRPRPIPQISDRDQTIVYRITKNTANKTPSFSTYASWPITEVVDVIDGEHEHNHLPKPYYSRRAASSQVAQPTRSSSSSSSASDTPPATATASHHHPYFESASSKRPLPLHNTRTTRPKTVKHEKQVRHEYTTSTGTHTTTYTTISTSRWMHDDEVEALNGGRTHKSMTTSSAPITLAKATGSLDEVLDDHQEQSSTPESDSVEATQCAVQESTNEQGTASNIEMRNDLKWKRRKMKLHIRKKRRDRLRYKKKAMQQRTQK